MFKKGVFLGLTMLFYLPLNSFSQVSTLSEYKKTSWTKTIEKDEIVIFEGKIQDDGAVPLKGHIIINYPIENVVTVMADSQSKKDWLPAVSKVEEIRRPDDYSKVEYFHVVMPFLVSDRTTVLESNAVVSDDLSEVIVTVKSTQQYPEINKSFVRARMDFGEVRLKSIDEGKKTIVSGIFYPNPEGMLPNWLVKRFTRQFVYESLIKLRHKVGRNVYSEREVKKYAELIKNYQINSRAIATSKK